MNTTQNKQSFCSGNGIRGPQSSRSKSWSVSFAHLDEIGRLDEVVDAAKQKAAETKALKLAEEAEKKKAKEADGKKKPDEKDPKEVKDGKDGKSEKTKKTDSKKDISGAEGSKKKK